MGSAFYLRRKNEISFEMEITDSNHWWTFNQLEGIVTIKKTREAWTSSNSLICFWLQQVRQTLEFPIFNPFEAHLDFAIILHISVDKNK